MSDVQQQPSWWMASNGKWYPPAEQAPKPGWWLASDGKWYSPRRAHHSTAPAVVDEVPTMSVAVAQMERPWPVEEVAQTREWETSQLTPSPAPAHRKPWWWALIVVVGGALMAGGSPLPWAKVSSGRLSVMVGGTYRWGGDGRITVGIGVLLLLLGAALWGLRSAFWRVPPIVVALAGLGYGIYEIAHISGFRHDVHNGSFGLAPSTTVAYGLVIVVAGGVVGTTGAIGALCAWRHWDRDERSDRQGMDVHGLKGLKVPGSLGSATGSLGRRF